MTQPQMPTIERVPWSQLGPEFIAIWGRADPHDPQPEHMEIVGKSGSGKTHLLGTVLQQRALARNTPTFYLVNKRADKTFAKIGWPVVDQFAAARRRRQAIFWPQTKALGTERRAYHEAKFYDVLSRLWVPDSNTIVAFDEVAYIESLSPRLRDMIDMYWREARSQGITVVAMKQRPQGANRHMSSETEWTAAFVPKDRADAERFAELFGARRDWLPVFDAMDPNRREFLIRHTRSRSAYVSWVDVPLVPRRKAGAASVYAGQR